MRVYIIMDNTESDIYEPFVCSTRADAEEMILSIMEEELWTGFNYACQDSVSKFYCIPTRFLPWDDEMYVNCKQCNDFMCEELKDLLDYLDLISCNHYEIVETEVI